VPMEQPPEVYTQAEERGFTIIDATCPSVRKCQKIAADLAQAGKEVVVVGHPDHPKSKVYAAGPGAVPP